MGEGLTNMGPEAKVESEIVAWALSNGGVALKLKLEGQRGFPDRTILLPGGFVMFVEVKKPKGGVVSQQQKDWVKRLTALGFQVCVSRSLAEVKLMYSLAKSSRDIQAGRVRYL